MKKVKIEFPNGDIWEVEPININMEGETMKFRQKSKLRGKWAFTQYKGNIAIYAVCQNCGYTYECDKKTKEDNPFILEPDKPSKYCPNCGLKMSLWDGNKIYKEGIDFNREDYYGL